MFSFPRLLNTRINLDHNITIKHTRLPEIIEVFLSRSFSFISIAPEKGPKIVWHASRPSPSIPCFPPLLFLPSLFPSPSFPFPLPFPPSLRSRHPQLRLGGLARSGERRCSPAKRILTHFRHKFAPFEYLMQLTDTLSRNIIGRLAQWGTTNFVLPHWASRPSPVATRPSGHKKGF